MNIRKLLTFLLLFVSYISFGQIVKGTGITYTNGIPTHVPRLGFDSEININMTTGKVYRWQRPTNTWFQIADGIDIWNGSGTPNYTPQYVQSPFAINLQRKVYYYQSGSWYCLNCAFDVIVAKNGLTIKQDTIYLGGYLDRTTEIDGKGIYPFRLDSLGLFYTAVNSTGGTAIQTMSLIPNTSAGINVTSTNKSTPTTNTNLNIRPGNPSQLKSTNGSQSAYYRLSPDSIIIGQGIAGGYLTTNKKIVITQDSLIFTNIDQTPYNYPVLVVSNDGTVYKDTSFISKILQDSSLINKIDTFAIVGNQLRISLLNDAEPYKQVNLLPYLDNTDTSGYNQTFVFSNDTLSITDGNGTLSVDLSTLNTVDTSGYNITFNISNDTLYITDDNSTLFVDLSQYLDNTDSSGYNFNLSLSNDTLYLEDGSSTLFVNLSSINTDNQQIDTFELSGNTLRLSISGDNEPFKSIDLSSIIPSLVAGQGISISGDTITNTGDLSIINEGKLGVIPNTINDARIISNTQGAIGVVISAGTGILVNVIQSSLDSGEIRIANNATLNVLNGTDSTSVIEINTDVGLGVVLLEQDNITLTESAGILNGDTIKISANVPVDTFALDGNKLVLSLLHDKVPADTVDLTPILGGNGIYGGSGNVPIGTIATINKTFTFLSTDTTGLEVPFRVEVSGNEPDLQVWSDGTDSLLLHKSDQEFEFFSNQDIIINTNKDLHFISDSLDISNLPTALANDTFVVVYGANNVLKKKSINQVGGNDGNGIYSGSGNVPAYTNPQLEGSLNFQSLVDTSKFQVSLGNLYSSNLTVKPDSISLFATSIGGTSSIFVSPTNIRLNTPTSGQIDITGNAMIYGANYAPFSDREIPDYAAVKSVVADSSYQLSAGTGISITGTQTKVITNTGDLSTTNEIQTLSFTTPNLSISGGNSVSLSTLVPTALQIPNTRIVYGTGTSVGSTYNMTYNPSNSQVLRISGLNTQGGILLDSLGASQPGLYIKNSNSDAGTFYGLKVERTAGNAATAIRVENTAGSGTNPDARLELFVNSGGSNDPEIIFYTGVEDYVIGIDNSVTGDVFKITPSSPMNSYDGITMLSDGSIGIETAPVTSIPFTTTTARITTLQTSGGSSGSSGQVLTSGGAGAFTWSTLVDNSITNEIQQIDTFAIVGSILRLSLSSDGVPFKTVDLSSFSGGSTDLSFSGTSSPVTLNSSTGTDVTITSGGINTLSATGSNITITATEVDGSITNEIQTIDTFQIVSNTLRLGLSGNTQPFQTVDLSTYLDNTDAQSLTFTGGSAPYTLDISGGSDVTFNTSGIVTLSRSSNELTIGATEVDGSITNEIQTIDTLSLSGSTLGVSLSGNTQPTQTVSLAPLLSGYPSGSGATNQIAVWSGTNTLTGDNNLRADAANGRIGLGSAAASNIDIYSSKTNVNNEILFQQDRSGLSGASEISGIRLGIGSGGNWATGYATLSLRRASTNSWSSIVQWNDIQTNGQGAAWTFPSGTNWYLNAGSAISGMKFLGNGGEVLNFISGYMPATAGSRYLDFGVRYSGSYTTPVRFWIDPTKGTDASSYFSWNTNGSSIELMRLHNSGNLSVNTTSDWATIGIKGQGATSSTYGLIVTNSGAATATASLVVRDDGKVGIGTNSPAQTFHVEGTARITGSTGTSTSIMGRDANGDISAITVGSGLSLSGNNLTATGELPSTGLANRLTIWNGTSAIGYESTFYADTTNNRLGLGAASPARTLDVNGEVRISDLTTDNPTKLVGADNDGDLSGVTIGTGLSFTGTTLNATGGAPAGQNSNIQFYKDGSFGADHLFTYDTIYNRIAIGVSTATATGTFRGNASISRVLLTENESGTDIVTVLREGYLKFGNLETYPRIFPGNTLQNVDLTRTGLIYDTRLSSSYNRIANYFKITFDSLSTASYYGIALDPSFAPVTTNSAWTAMYIGSTINQTGGSSGITRGIQIAPLLTSAYDYRALEISNTSGKAIYQTSTEPTNILAGKTSIGSTSAPTSTLDVSGSLELGYVEKTSTYTATSSDFTINCTSGSFTINLPTAVGITGRIYVIKNTGVGTITVDGNGSETIDGGEIADIPSYYQLMIQSTGSGWIIISYF